MQQLLDQVATGDLSAIRDKLVGQIAVLDAIFHQAAREATTCIPGSHQQQRVLKLAQDVQNQFLKASLTLEHFRAPVRLPERVDVSRLDAWLIQRAQQLGTTRILVSQLARFGPVEYRSGQGREVALDVLEKANRIRVVERDDASGHVIEINPRLLALEEMEKAAMNDSQMWSLDDYEDGLCTGEQVGTPRTPGASEDEHELLAEVRAMGGNPDSLAEVGMHLYRKNPEQFMADYPSVYNKLVELAGAAGREECREAERLLDAGEGALPGQPSHEGGRPARRRELHPAGAPCRLPCRSRTGRRRRTMSLPLKAMLAELADRERIAGDLFTFAWEVVLRNIPGKVPGVHHMLKTRTLERLMSDDEKQDLYIGEPPRSGKTLYASLAFPAWALGHQPRLRVIIASSTTERAEMLTGNVRDLVADPEYQRIFPDTVLNPASLARGNWTTAAGGSMLGAGVGKAIQGAAADLAVIDDPYASLDDAFSVTTRAAITSWYHGTLRTRLEPGAKLVLVCQRMHRGDLAGMMMDNFKENPNGRQLDMLILPAMCDDPETDPLGRAEGELLWPGHHDEKYLAPYREDPYVWRTLYMQRPPVRRRRLGGRCAVRPEPAGYQQHAGLHGQRRGRLGR